MRQPQCSWMRRLWARQERVFVHAKSSQWCFFLSFKIKNNHVIIIYIHIHTVYIMCFRFGQSSVGSLCGRPQRCWAWKLTCWVVPCGAARFGCSMLAASLCTRPGELGRCWDNSDSRLWSADDFRTNQYKWSSSYPKAWRILLYSVYVGLRHCC